MAELSSEEEFAAMIESLDYKEHAMEEERKIIADTFEREGFA